MAADYNRPCCARRQPNANENGSKQAKTGLIGERRKVSALQVTTAPVSESKTTPCGRLASWTTHLPMDSVADTHH